MSGLAHIPRPNTINGPEIRNRTRTWRPYQLHLVGDANAPRDLPMAIREGRFAGRIQETEHD